MTYRRDADGSVELWRLPGTLDSRHKGLDAMQERLFLDFVLRYASWLWTRLIRPSITSSEIVNSSLLYGFAYGSLDNMVLYVELGVIRGLLFSWKAERNVIRTAREVHGKM